MVQSEMFPHLDLDTRHVKSIHIPRVPLARRITVFVWFVNQTYRNSSLGGCDGSVGVSLIRDPIHDDIDLLCFSIQVLLRARQEILTAVWCRREVEFGIDWRRRILAR